ncbi:hypothetical protein TSH100_16090 [Azospirillum sp. TSH100]|uniref:hypothetical protein n=1 Tax=Azospirillum sp. TSH100 TaxID=652764 RepID=UPI000D60D074|nr:hypothetical protein [Azospirillum sp. TSH100]PWC85229.1 hypothetical protein TSH100_16090 [Azospirillum sp. TSH100]QCG88851.1 hypothetical protein E6C72_13485 [Azospirillum sp. TSH100]
MRRERLSTRPSPDARHDFLVELNGQPLPGVRLTLRLVPDLLVPEPASVVAYLAEFAGFGGTGGSAGGLEALAVAILDDLNNELVPRWVEVAVESDVPLPHRVVIEDRQPTWDNPRLLGRLRLL